MSLSPEVENLEEPEFRWGKKRGIGGRKKDVQFYESFTYDGVEYALYDCVYMHKQGESEPYIGKLVKIWENADKSKKVKVHWFFRPLEISYYLKDTEVLENELFFAAGDGKGLANLNPLEAIAGKCDVVCTSTDSRNPPPSATELQMATYVFYRIFDVKSCVISDQMDDIVGGLEVKFVFNRRQSITSFNVLELDSNSKDEEKNVIVCEKTLTLGGMNPLQQSNHVKPDGDGDPMVEKEDTNVKGVQVNQGSLVGVKEDTNVKVTQGGLVVEKEDMNFKLNQGSLVGEKEHTNVKVNQGSLVGEKERMNVKVNKKSLVGEKEDTNVKVNKKSLVGEKEDTNVKGVQVNQGILVGESSKQVAELVKSSSASKKRPLETSVDLSKEKSNPRNDACHKNKDATIAKDLCLTEEGTPKRAKIDASIETLKDNKNNSIKKLKEKSWQGETKKSLTLVNSHEAKSRLGHGAPKKYHSDEVNNLSNDNLPNTFEGDDKKVEGQIFEVTQRPYVEKSNWIKLPWEQKMKSAHDQGRLVLLQNLDPEYTSEEVEDIIWHAFKENCTARMVQHTAISSPHSGQAFVIFKTKKAVDKVVKKLDDGCLMLPNQRPLVVSSGVFPKFFEKQTTFVGHLTVDRARWQIQREMKEAVSTSHYSQNNTIEYEMAMSWCLLQSKSDKWWAKLYEQQRKELKKLRDDLKSK